MEQFTILDVPFSEKDTAKSRGARVSVVGRSQYPFNSETGVNTLTPTTLTPMPKKSNSSNTAW